MQQRPTWLIPPHTPAALSPAAVAALTAADTMPSSSSYSSTKVHLAAPGVNILSTFNTADNAYVTQSGAGRAGLQGESEPRAGTATGVG